MEEKSVLLQRKDSTGRMQYLYPVTSADNILISIDANPTIPTDNKTYEEQLDEVFNDVRNKVEGMIAGVAPYDSTFVYGIKGKYSSDYKTGNVVLTKDDVGLDKVDNTSDSEKVVLAATRLNNPINVSTIGAAVSNTVSWDGSSNLLINVTSLDASKLTGVIPSNMIPSQISNIPQYGTFAEAVNGETFFLVDSIEEV